MKKRLIILLTVASLTILSSQSAFAKKDKEVNEEVVAVVAPATPTLVNGVPEQETFSTMSSGQMFHSYSPNTPTRVEKFREIVKFTHDNSLSSTSYNMSVSITQSQSQGSEFYGEITFSAEVKAGIFQAVGGQITGGVKETRSYNEAVGVSGSLTVPAYKKGEIIFYYAAVGTNGTLTMKTYHSSLGSYTYQNYAINAKIHKNYLDVHSVARTY